MKNQRHNILISLTCLFVAFLLGFLVGRNYNHADIQVSNLTPQPITAPAATESVPVTTVAIIEVTAEATLSATESALAAVETTSPPSETTASTHPEDIEATASSETQASGLININTATLSQLVTLPGIGEVIGQRIIDYREANGPFTNIAQITNVSGIGSKRFDAIADLITVE